MAMYGATVRRAAVFNAGHGAYTPIQFDTEDRDDGDIFDAGSDTMFTVPVTGWYSVSGYVDWPALVNYVPVYNYIRVDGATYTFCKGESSAGGEAEAVVSGLLYLTAGQYVELVVYNSDPTNDRVIDKAAFSIVLIASNVAAPIPLGAYVYRTVAQSINLNTPTLVSWDGVYHDEDDYHDPGDPSKLTAPVDGWYIIACSGRFNFPGFQNDRKYALLLNGTVVAKSTWPYRLYGDQSPAAFGWPIYMTAGQYVQYEVEQGQANPFNLSAAEMQIVRIAYDGIIPVITSLTPNHGAVGSAMVIDGSNFGAVQGSGGVTVNGVAAAVTAWADTQISVTIPVGATTGYVVVIDDAGGISDGCDWVLGAAPVISTLTPNSGVRGSVVTIAGTGFGTVWGNVRFNGALSFALTWADTQITCVVPVEATTGGVVVVDSNGLSSNSPTMTVTDAPPTLSDGNTVGEDEGADFYACVRLGQFFVPLNTMQAVYVKIKGKKTGTPGVATFEIHEADVNGFPTGALLGKGTSDANTWTIDATGQWVLVPVTSGTVLQAGRMYTLTWYTTVGDGSNKGHGKRQKSGSLVNAGALHSVDCGVTWVTEPAVDYIFEVIGTVPSTVVSRPTGGARAAVGFAPIG